MLSAKYGPYPHSAKHLMAMRWGKSLKALDFVHLPGVRIQHLCCPSIVWIMGQEKQRFMAGETADEFLEHTMKPDKKDSRILL